MTTEHSRPVLPGEGINDYVRYMRTDELLALQRTADQWVHPDELLFQITHQSTELWLKLAGAQLDRAAAHVADGETGHAELLVQRAATALRLITEQLDILRHLTPADFNHIRPALGNGSGAESPGWQGLRRAARRLGAEFDARLAADGVELGALYRGDPTVALYRLAEALVALDERIALWRTEHYKIATRIIGHAVLGTQGTPVDTLARLIAQKLFPKLWQIRTEITKGYGS
ncbi:tryptophan 2,3-dioxygenase family protein [Catenuloplanes sp. NPDC051500]|uniref:tryptophan 2,3-dioxygenase family protein n=1 Tax=Catenuloplanes sp. NPDC051500 TaxID=3363959 RepID=UPI0037BACCDD